MQRVRILTYNIAHGRGLNPIQGLTTGTGLRRNLKKIADLIKLHQPDIVALQEIDVGRPRSGRLGMLRIGEQARRDPRLLRGLRPAPEHDQRPDQSLVQQP